MKIYQGLFPTAAFLFSGIVSYRVGAKSILHPPLYSVHQITQLLNASNAHSSATNLTILGDSTDPFFGLIPTFKGPKLDENSALLNSVDAALQLALEEITALLGEKVYTLHSHPEVQIKITPSTSQGFATIPRRFAVWGLNIAIDLMIRTRNFQSAVFVLTRGGREIATIEYKVAGGYIDAATDGPGPRQIVAAQDDSTTSPYDRTIWLEQADARNDTSTITHPTSRKDPELHVMFHLAGRSLDKYSIYYAALDVLRSLSSYRQTERVDDSTTPILTADLELTTIDASEPPRTSRNPLYFQVQWLMMALAQMPAFMLGQGIFSEVSMEISVDRTMVGLVLLERGDLDNGLVQSS